MPTNLELKARIRNLNEIRQYLSGLSARKASSMVQVDTYFRHSPGRVKLREMSSGKSELIWYQRPNRRSERFSQFSRIPVRKPRELKDLLRKTLGIRDVVRKRRTVFLYRNARIHLDEVAGLGSFLEFEVLVTRGKRQARRLLELLKDACRISARSIVVSSYIDLMNLKRKNTLR